METTKLELAELAIIVDLIEHNAGYVKHITEGKTYFRYKNEYLEIEKIIQSNSSKEELLKSLKEEISALVDSILAT